MSYLLSLTMIIDLTIAAAFGSGGSVFITASFEASLALYGYLIPI